MRPKGKTEKSGIPKPDKNQKKRAIKTKINDENVESNTKKQKTVQVLAAKKHYT